MSTLKNVYSKDRNEAAESLKVSLRTLDRYIGAGLLNVKREKGKILLCETEILEFQRMRGTFLKRFLPKPMTKTETVPLQPRPEAPLPESREPQNLSPGEKIFQKLYTDLRLEVKEQQKRLEGANYRVGQLEAQLKNAVPLLDYHAESLKLKQKEAELLFEKETLTREAEQAKTDKEKTLSRAQFDLTKLQNALFTEKINKWAYIVVLFLVLLAQPVLWVLLEK